MNLPKGKKKKKKKRLWHGTGSEGSTACLIKDGKSAGQALDLLFNGQEFVSS